MNWANLFMQFEINKTINFIHLFNELIFFFYCFLVFLTYLTIKNNWLLPYVPRWWQRHSKASSFNCCVNVYLIQKWQHFFVCFWEDSFYFTITDNQFIWSISEYENKMCIWKNKPKQELCLHHRWCSASIAAHVTSRNFCVHHLTFPGLLFSLTKVTEVEFKNSFIAELSQNTLKAAKKEIIHI